MPYRTSLIISADGALGFAMASGLARKQDLVLCTTHGKARPPLLPENCLCTHLVDVTSLDLCDKVSTLVGDKLISTLVYAVGTRDQGKGIQSSYLMNVNCNGLFRILDCLMHRFAWGARVVLFSSQLVRKTERDSDDARLYVQSKRLLEDQVRIMQRNERLKGMSVFIVRPPSFSSKMTNYIGRMLPSQVASVVLRVLDEEYGENTCVFIEDQFAGIY